MYCPMIRMWLHARSRTVSSSPQNSCKTLANGLITHFIPTLAKKKPRYLLAEAAGGLAVHQYVRGLDLGFYLRSQVGHDAFAARLACGRRLHFFPCALRFGKLEIQCTSKLWVRDGSALYRP